MKRLLLITALATLALPAGAAGASRTTVDLATGSVNGHLVLGRTIAGVTAALGRPDFRGGSRSHYVIGWGTRPNFAFEVIFRPVGGVERAWSIAFERGPVRDVKLGDLVGRSPLAFQRAMRVSYADTFALDRPYACKGRLCAVGFAARSGPLHVNFGTQPKLGTWLTVYRALSS